MKVENIVSCICCDGIESDNSSDFGMPQLVLHQFISGYSFSAFCPNCGRGSKLDDYKSAYLALKHWNKLQSDLRKIDLLG